MQLAMINIYDTSGGAAKAGKRLCDALADQGSEIRLLVSQKFGRDPMVHPVLVTRKQRILDHYYRYRESRLLAGLKKKPEYSFSAGLFGTDPGGFLSPEEPVHLHWINRGFLSVKSVARLGRCNRPIFWTLHDMWPFTGGCHYTLGCTNYTRGCVDCPAFRTKTRLPARMFQYKQKYFNRADIHFIACSNWMAQKAKKSPILKNKPVTPLGNTLPTHVYKPLNRGHCRQVLNLPAGKFLILFGAMSTLQDTRKGYALLKSNLEWLMGQYPDLKQEIELVLVGADTVDAAVKALPLNTHVLGTFQDDCAMSVCYNSADLTLIPSLQENLSNMVLESMSCGTPVVAYNLGGMPDMIRHKHNGYLASKHSDTDLARGIRYLYSKRHSPDEMRSNARTAVLEHFSPQVIAARHLAFYQRAFNGDDQ